MTAATDTPLTLTVSHRYRAPREAVFDAWLDPGMLQRFMQPGPGMSVPRADTDPREGGRFDIVMEADGQEIPHHGIYRSIERPERLVFTWQSPYSVPDSTVTLTFAEVEGGTEVTLTHVRFADEGARDNHRGGWTAILAALETAL